MRYVLLGGRGILGSGFRTSLARRGVDVHLVRPPWSAPEEVPGHLRAELIRLASAGGPTTVLWAAGVGHVGASEDDLAAETAGLAAVGDALRALPEPVAAGTTVVFASSGGALYGGQGPQVVQEDTPPCPVAPYGKEKLRQEGLLREVAEQTGARVVACRMSNVYGLAQGRLSARGLVSTAVRCTRLRQPMTVFVSPDTRRDYLLSSDAAELALEAGAAAPQGFSTALVREGRSRTVAEVLALVGAVARRRVPATYAERPQTRLQPRVLRFAPLPPGAGRVRLTPMETGIALMVRAPLAG
ncbi:MAG TPA: NAD-dependent epimerase/dehydratase family protein [Mycobacteriales bacterium]|nr:NAD-dependent epimerase/dehydratase family protein [Mycobacteriales bacterium]